MAETYTTTATVGGVGGYVIPPYYADFMREQLWANLYLRPLGTRVTIPRGYGDKVKIPRWASPLTSTNGLYQIVGAQSAVSAGITEGNIGSLKSLSAQDITGNVIQFIGGRGYTDKLIIVTRANYLEGALEVLGRELAYRHDRHTLLNISGVATKRQAGETAGKAGTGDGLFGKNVAKIRPFMNAGNVPAWPDEHYVAVAHPLCQYDIYRDISATGFVPVARYNNADRVWRGEIGAMFGIRFLLSNVIPLYGGTANGRVAAASATNGISGGATGSNAWVFAPDAFYSIELEDGGIEVIHHPLGSGGATGDWANQRGSISVKSFYGVVGAPSTDGRLMRYAHGIGLHY